MIRKTIFTISTLIGLALVVIVGLPMSDTRAVNDSLVPNLNDPELEQALNTVRQRQTTPNPRQEDPAASPDETTAVSAEDFRKLQELFQALDQNSLLGQNRQDGNDFELDLIWKTNTLVPYDYPGKALPGALSAISVYALANVPNPEKLEYNWIVDDASSYREGPDQVGIGQSVFNWITFVVPNYTHRIKVSAKDPSTEKVSSASLSFKTQRPEAYVYFKQNNNYNNLSPARMSFLPDQEQMFLIRPFYFNAANIAGLDFNWYLDGEKIDESSAQPDILPIHISKRTTLGTQTNIRLEVINKSKSRSANERVNVRRDISVAGE
ncbi:MAG: hypothetical protein HY454_00170 [Parcubacteria group bacterium]|nr:hypothetical protein [Parcubacteria group bacterium]